jgi:ribosome assembly protein RRB1
MGGVNRIRSMPQLPGIIATMSETGKAHIFDLTNTLNAFMTKGSPRATALVTKPIYSFTGNQDEGYAIDWNPIITGRLITGDCSGAIRLWNPSQSFNNINNNNKINNNTNNGGSFSSSSSNLSSFSWQVDNQSLHSHKGSVEDLQWSPSEATVFASCSSDRSIKIWDIRDKSKAQISIDAHEEDVNVISWNKSVAYLLASGCDDGSFKVK